MRTATTGRTRLPELGAEAVDLTDEHHCYLAGDVVMPRGIAGDPFRVEQVHGCIFHPLS